MAQDGITLQLKGTREIVRALRELRDDLPKNLIRSALRSSADRMRKVIVAFAPRRTGTLVNAISVKASSANGVSRARVVINTSGKRGDPENAYYWRFLEKGWHDRAGSPHQVQFVKPAFETEANDAAQNVINVVEKAIQRAEERGRS